MSLACTISPKTGRMPSGGGSPTCTRRLMPARGAACSLTGSPSVSSAPIWPPNPNWLNALSPAPSPAQAGQLLTTYARAAHHPAFQGQLDAQLTSLCVRHHSTLALPAIDVATQLEASAPLIDALRQLTTNPDTPREYLAKMAGRLPPASQNLAEWAAELAQRLTDEDRRLATEDPDAFLPDLAGSLHNLSGRLPAWAGGRTRWPRARKPPASAGSWPRPSGTRSAPTSPGRCTTWRTGSGSWGGGRTRWPRARKPPPSTGSSRSAPASPGH